MYFLPFVLWGSMYSVSTAKSTTAKSITANQIYSY